MDNFNITLFEACELLERSKKSIGRYVRKGLLKPETIRSRQGTKEYRFSLEDIEDFKRKIDEQAPEEQNNKEDTTGDRQEKTEDTTRQTQAQQEETGNDRQFSEQYEERKEMTDFLKEQLRKKDEQIDSLGGKIDGLIERDRETNVLLKSLQDKILALEAPKEAPEEEGQERQEERQDRQDSKKEEKPGFFKRIWKRKQQ